MACLTWGAKLPRTPRFEVDPFMNIIDNVAKTPNKKRALEEASGQKRKKTKWGVCVVDGPQPPPPMPQEFKNRILELLGENSVITEKLVMQKRVESSDVDKGKNRLSIPAGKMLCGFLEKDEESQLRNRSPLNCKIIEPNLNLGEVKLSDWKIFYALNGGWNEVKTRNTIVPKLVVQLWAVRVDGVLLFVLVDITTPEEKAKFIEEAVGNGILPYKK